MHRICKSLICVGVLILSVASVAACTIVILADEKNVLFCNNEDWSEPKTCIWFVSGTAGKFGCVYVGFATPYGQGGMNERGVAYDWVAGHNNRLDRTPEMAEPKGGNSCARMLESCSTVDEAIAYFRTHWEPSLQTSRILIADSSGSSVVIGARDGKLEIMKAKGSRCFGFGETKANRMLLSDAAAKVANAERILRATRQEGQFATKYSNVFNLKSREIFLTPANQGRKAIRLELGVELAKGTHSYDMHNIGRWAQ